MKYPNPFNRKCLIFGVAMLVFMLLASVASAGWLGERFEDLAIGKGLGLVIGGVFTVLGILGYKVVVWRKTALELKDVIVAVYDSTRPNSPGGAKITGDELDNKILPEVGQFGRAMLEGFVAIRSRK